MGDGYDVVVCTRCGAGFADGVPSQPEMDRYYAEQSKYSYDPAGGCESPWDFARFEATADQVVSHLKSKEARILDIGCATGGLLSVFERRGFPNVTGVDPSPECAEAAARLYALKVRTAALSGIRGWTERFDLVLMLGTLEHIREAGDAVRTAAGLLAPGGLLYCAVPDTEGLPEHPGSPYQQFSVEHVNFFSLHSLDRLLGSCGLAPVDRARWSVEWRSGVIEPIASGLYRAGPVAPASFDAATGPALERYLEISREGDREILGVIEAIARSREPILVWGAGSLTRRLLATTRLGEASIAAFVDGNTHLAGGTLAGKPILSPGELGGRGETILISSLAFREEILGEIRGKRGLRNPVISLTGEKPTGSEGPRETRAHP